MKTIGLPVDCLQLAIVNRLSQPVEILICLITLNHQHLHQWDLIRDTGVEVPHVFPDVIRVGSVFNIAAAGFSWLASGFARLTLESHSWGVLLLITLRFWSLLWGFGGTTRIHFKLAQIHLNFLGDHFIENGGGDVREWLAKRFSHLLFDLPFQESVQWFTLQKLHKIDLLCVYSFSYRGELSI